MRGTTLRSVRPADEISAGSGSHVMKSSGTARATMLLGESTLLQDFIDHHPRACRFCASRGMLYFFETSSNLTCRVVSMHWL